MKIEHQSERCAGFTVPGISDFVVATQPVTAQTESASMLSHFLRAAGILLLLSAAGSLFAQTRTVQSLDANWKFSRENPPRAEQVGFNDSYWEKVSVPHTWNARDGQDGGGDYYRGMGWYRRSLSVDEAMRNKKLYLRFDGASSSADVYVNGKLAGKHKGAFSAFCFDISPLVKVGQNLIAVKVSNAKDTTISPLRGDFTIYGGLYRGVQLLVLENLSISPLDEASSGVYIRQSQVTEDSATLDITTKLLNEGAQQKSPSIRFTVKDREGKAVVQAVANATLAPDSKGEVLLSVTMHKPHLWNGRIDPYLYSLTVEVIDQKKIKDRVVQDFGIRSFTIDAEKGFFLNGKPYRLYGVNRHQDRENMGWAITKKQHQEDMKLIEEIGANAVRLAHYQHAQEFYDLCDRNGMVVWAELALVDEIHPNPEFAVVCQQQLRELIKQNFNHPSIFFWSLQNELIPDSNPKLYAQFVQDLNALSRQLDPTRLTAVASRSKYSGDDGINNATDVIAYNVYRGWYEGKPEDFGKFVDKLHERFPKQRMAISEYGAGASVNQHEYPPKKPPTRGPWHPEEWQSTLHEITWKQMVERPYLWGTFIWNMFDFGSDGRSEGERYGQNDKGLMSFDRTIRKDAFYWYKANWNPEPMVHITSKRFSPRPPGRTDLKVYSNCEAVELFLNGKSLGTKKSADKLFLWTEVELNAGSARILAVATKNGTKFRDECMITVAEQSNIQPTH